MKMYINISFILLLATVVTLLLSSAVVEARKCNGLQDLCQLKLDQVTFPGSHNAGSGFDGVMAHGSGVLASSCFFRNQGKSFSEQLDMGVRYFDIDSCYHKNAASNCHCNNGKSCAYAGSIEKGLRQIDTWLKANSNEVLIIHFNRDVQPGYRSKIAKSIQASLLKLWGPGRHVQMSDYYNKNSGKWPTLKEAIESKKRIFIFMDRKLVHHLNPSGWLLLSNSFIASTWGSFGVSSSCSDITKNAKADCTTTKPFVALEAFASYGLCVWDMATLCSKWLGEAQDACFEKRYENGKKKTVNFLLVDWIDYFSGYESVINKAKFMNQKNIKKYLGKDIFFPELQGCSYHPGWFYNYCWQAKPGYSWCWINEYCGKDPDICKQKSFSCY